MSTAFKPLDIVRNRAVSFVLQRQGPNPGEWFVKQFTNGFGHRPTVGNNKEFIMTEERLLEIAADASVRSMTMTSDRAAVTTGRPHKPMNPIRLAQLKLADRRAILMRSN